MLNHLRLGQQLVASYLLMAVLVCGTGFFGIHYTVALGGEGVGLSENLWPLGDASMEIGLATTQAHLILEKLMAGDTNHSINEVWKLLSKAQWYVNAILQGGTNERSMYVPVKDPRIRNKMKRVKEQLVKLVDLGRYRYKLLGTFEEGTAGSASDVAFDNMFKATVLLTQEAEAMIHEVTLEGVDHLRSNQSRAKMVMIAAMLIAVLIALISGTLLARSITQPINAVAKLSLRIADGDLSHEQTQKILSGRGDEIGTLIQAFDEMRKNIREAIENLQKGAADLEVRSTDVGATAAQYAATASEQASAVAQISTTIEEIMQTSQMAADAAQDVVTSAEEAVESGRQGLDAVAGAVEMTEVIGERVEGIAGKILQLSERNAQISEIVETVNDLAEQSNLLAVNASIEAAQAGDQGRRFAVVAAEVRNLAEQSKRAAQQIRSILREIQSATESAVMATEEGTKRAEDGRKTMGSVRAVVEELAGVLEESSHKARQIAGASSQQVSGIAQIAQAINDVQTAGQNNLTGVQQLENSAAGLSGIGSRMRSIVNQYRL